MEPTSVSEVRFLCDRADIISPALAPRALSLLHSSTAPTTVPLQPPCCTLRGCCRVSQSLTWCVCEPVVPCWELGPASYQSGRSEKLRLARFRRLIKRPIPLYIPPFSHKGVNVTSYESPTRRKGQTRPRQDPRGQAARQVPSAGLHRQDDPLACQPRCRAPVRERARIREHGLASLHRGWQVQGLRGNEGSR